MQAGDKPQQPLKKSAADSEDYEIVGDIGKGAYGRVSLARRSSKLYAIKQIEKKKLAKQGKEYQAFVEKELLRKINHPGIIRLVKCYQDSKNLNYVLEYCHGGDFTNFMRFNHRYFTQELRRFYVAQIVNVLEYLHGVGITHRDLKPENIMLSKDGHLKLIDFGTAEISRCTILDQKFKDDIEKQKKAHADKKAQMQQATQNELNEDEEEVSPRKRRSTFVGTCFYLSPQLLQMNICEPPSDLWALGCIIYQLYYLEPPFKAPNQYQIFQKIKNVEVSFPKNESITEDAIDLIKKLLVKVPEDRLGANQKQGLMFSDLKAHPFFKSVPIDTIFSQKVPELKQEEYHEQESLYRLEKAKKQIQGEHEQLFQHPEEIIYSGMVEKKTFASYSAAYLILRRPMQLILLTTHHSEEQRVTLTPLNETALAEKLEGNRFRVVMDESNYTIRTPEAEKWVELLNAEYVTGKAA